MFYRDDEGARLWLNPDEEASRRFPRRWVDLAEGRENIDWPTAIARGADLTRPVTFSAPAPAGANVCDRCGKVHPPQFVLHIDEGAEPASS